MKLKNIYIKGFKDPDREVNLTFSEESVTVIYGVNGSGKTTLLKILHAIFTKDENVLRRENVQEIRMVYEMNKKSNEFFLKKKKNTFPPTLFASLT